MKRPGEIIRAGEPPAKRSVRGPSVARGHAQSADHGLRPRRTQGRRTPRRGAPPDRPQTASYPPTSPNRRAARAFTFGPTTRATHQRFGGPGRAAREATFPASPRARGCGERGAAPRGESWRSLGGRLRLHTTRDELLAARKRRFVLKLVIPVLAADRFCARHSTGVWRVDVPPRFRPLDQPLAAIFHGRRRPLV
jgi:hypothetical protein